MIVLGIDPGLTGALAFMENETAQLVALYDFPLNQRKVGKRMQRRVAWQRLLSPEMRVLLLDTDQAFIEDVHAMPGQGVSSSFNFGRTVGGTEATMAAFSIPVTFVTPQAWQKRAGVVGGKSSSRARAMELFPEWAERFTRVKDDGRADAALIAYAAFHKETMNR